MTARRRDNRTVLLPRDDVGSGPAVVLLHAGITDRRMWAEHLAPLADASLRAVALDLPGFGEAEPGAGADAPWLDVLDTMDSLGIERAVLVGNSYGGAVAQRVAYLAPARVAALVLVSSPAPLLDPSPELAAAWAAEEAALERRDIDAAVEAVVEAWTLSDAKPELRRAIADMQRRAFDLQAALQGAEEADDPLGEEALLLASFTAPVLVVTGARDFSDFDAAAEVLAEVLPDARRVTLEDAGHLAPLEQPVAFREVMLDFLAALP